MLAVYGNCCAICGFSDPDCLQLDHIEDNGSRSRQELVGNKDRAGHVYYAKLKRLGWPREGYQILCANCNTKKEAIRRRIATEV